jgi:hypothetical protein
VSLILPASCLRGHHCLAVPPLKSQTCFSTQQSLLLDSETLFLLMSLHPRGSNSWSVISLQGY